MELRQLRHFCRACELGSLTAAARDLFVTEQTVSSAIAKLEAQMGVRLLERDRRGVVPTDAGQVACRYGLKVLQAASAFERHVRAAAEQGVVRFAYVNDSMSDEGTLLPFDIIWRFERAHPGVRVQTSECPGGMCLDLVSSGAADIALVAGEPDPTRFDASLVVRGALDVALATTNSLAARTSLTCADLRDQPVSQPPETDYTLDALTDRCRAHGFGPVIVATPRRLYFGYAIAGKGVAFVPRGHSGTVCRDDLVAVPLDDSEGFGIPLYLVVKRGVLTVPAVRAFREHVFANVGACDTPGEVVSKNHP